MKRIDHDRVVWIMYGEERRRYAIPMNYSSAHIAREAYIGFAKIQGKVGDFPKDTTFVLHNSDARRVPPSTKAEDLREGATYDLVLEMTET